MRRWVHTGLFWAYLLTVISGWPWYVWTIGSSREPTGWLVWAVALILLLRRAAHY